MCWHCLQLCVGVVCNNVLALFVMMCWRCLQVSEGGGRRNVRQALPLVAQKTRRFLQPRREHQAESRGKSKVKAAVKVNRASLHLFIDIHTHTHKAC